MRQFLFKATAIIALVLFVSNAALAQTCSSAEAAGLDACVTNSVFSCKADFASCDSLNTALTIEDITDIAVDRCCFKRKRSQRRACLTVERRKYNSRPRNGDQKTFFLAARNAITELRAGDCNGNAYATGF